MLSFLSCSPTFATPVRYSAVILKSILAEEFHLLDAGMTSEEQLTCLREGAKNTCCLRGGAVFAAPAEGPPKWWGFRNETLGFVLDLRRRLSLLLRLRRDLLRAGVAVSELFGLRDGLSLE